MDLFQEFFVSAMVALIVSCIIVKLVSAAVSNDGKVDHKERVVVEEAKITKGLVVKSRKSKKRVKFVEEEVVGNVDNLKIQKGVVDQSENAKKVASEDEVFVEKKIEGILEKGDDFKGEKVPEKVDLIEQCDGEREVSDGHDDAEMSSKIGLLEENDEVKKVEKKIEDILKKGDDFKGEKVLETLDLIEHCGGEREVSDVHDDPDMSSKIGLLEENDEVKKVEKKIEDILEKGDDIEGEKVPENLDLIEPCGGESEVSDVHDDADMCRKIGLLEGKVEVKKIDELLVVKEKDIANDLVVDEVKLGENKVDEVDLGLSKKTDKMVMNEDSDDDWEGIERSELDEEFVKAVNFVNGENLGSELMMQLYGLQKIAMEGPCHEPQPMALKVYARAKWNAWQKMGSMNPEVAMEQYIKLLSEHVPRWMHHNKDGCEAGSSETKVPVDPDSFTDTHKNERTQEMNHAAEAGDFTGGEKDTE